LNVSRPAESRTTRTNSGCGNSRTTLPSIFEELFRFGCDPGRSRRQVRGPCVTHEI
jgi:hypothetical protein